MKFTDDTAHRCLAYVAGVSRHGHRLGVREFEAFAKAPERERSSPLVKSMKQLSETVMGGVVSESVLDWLVRLGWLDRYGFSVRITPLGTAVLSALEDQDAELEVGTELVLSPTDALAYPRLLSVIADSGECSLIDPYFNLDQLLTILQHTQVDQILIREDAGTKAGLATAVEATRVDRPLEIRASGDFHDRFIIPRHGKVRVIGTSLNGVGRRVSVSLEVGDVASNGIRAEFRAAWEAATVVVAAMPPDPEAPPNLEAV